MNHDTNTHNQDFQETEHMLNGATALIRKSRKSLWQSYKLLAEARIVLQKLPPQSDAGSR